MLVRRTLAGAVAAALAGSAIVFSAGTASAAVDPDDTTFTPVSADLVGVGSDTSQHAIKLFAESFNAATPAPAFRIATYAATGGGTIPIPNGDITRPNGSGQGKGALFGGGNDPDVDFARSSSANSTAETSAGLQAFPFALDTLVMAVSNSVVSHAPTALTNAQIVQIYKGEVTNWSQVGGTAGVIAPKIPQSGSGTRKFFEDQLKAMNGGTAVTLVGVGEVQEHDDTLIKNDPNAIAPFSKGRAGLLGGTLRLEAGFKADRALYNVVRGTDLGNASVQAAFGVSGALCSTAMRDEIETAGFKQLAAPPVGVCGEATQGATSNFATNSVVTTTDLVATSPSARTAHLVATLSGSSAPQGTVDFLEGATVVANDVPLVSGAATTNLTNVTPGAHTYRAVFNPGIGFDASEDTATVTVSAVVPKVATRITETFPAKAHLKRAKAVAVKGTISVKGGSSKATGTITVKKGHKVLKRAALHSGSAHVKLPKLKKGTYHLTITYPGDAAHQGSTKTFTIKVVK